MATEDAGPAGILVTLPNGRAIRVADNDPDDDGGKAFPPNSAESACRNVAALGCHVPSAAGDCRREMRAHGQDALEPSSLSCLAGAVSQAGILACNKYVLCP